MTPLPSPPMFSPGSAVAPLGRLAIRLGQRLRRALEHLGSLAWLARTCIGSAVRLRPAQLGVLEEVARNQVRFTAIEALPLIALTALLVGGVTQLQVQSQLADIGGEAHLSELMALVVVRELGPLLVAVIVVGRSATAIAAEMASMKLDRQVATLYAIGVDPVSYLLVPRIVGGILSIFTLLVLFDALALFGGFAIAAMQLPLSFALYLRSLQAAIGPAELLGTALKAAAFGALIPLAAAHAGLRLEHSSTEIPKAVTRAAVDSMIAIFLASALLSILCYG